MALITTYRIDIEILLMEIEINIKEKNQVNYDKRPDFLFKENTGQNLGPAL